MRTRQISMIVVIVFCTTAMGPMAHYREV